MPKQFNEQRNGRRTDPLDDFKSLQMQVFIATVEESSQQRQRTPRPLDQGGFGDRPDLRVFGHHGLTDFPSQSPGRSSWLDSNA